MHRLTLRRICCRCTHGQGVGISTKRPIAAATWATTLKRSGLEFTPRPAAYLPVIGLTQRAHFHATSNQFHYDKVDLSKESCIFFQEFKSGLEDGSIFVIDVRRQDEVDKGHVPAKRYGHVHIEELDDALNRMSDADFQKKYGFEKPKKDAGDVVYFCRLGVRSSRAVKIAKDAGYERPRHYPGGWAVWQERKNE